MGIVTFDTNEYIEALKALEMVNCMLDRADNDLYYWKWVIIAFHNAIQALIACSIMGTDGSGVLSKKSRIEFRKHYEQFISGNKEEANKVPIYWMEDFCGLYKRFVSKHCYHEVSDMQYNMGLLNHMRKTLAHFKPQHYSIILNGLPKVFLECLHLIKYITDDPQKCFKYNYQMNEEAKIILKDIESKLLLLNKKY